MANLKHIQYQIKSVSDTKVVTNAMKLVAKTNRGPIEQNPSMGCSIKWFS